MNINVKGIRYKSYPEILNFRPYEINEIDQVIVEFKACNNKVKMEGELTVDREEFEKNVTNLEQMVKVYILD